MTVSRCHHGQKRSTEYLPTLLQLHRSNEKRWETDYVKWTGEYWRGSRDLCEDTIMSVTMKNWGKSHKISTTTHDASANIQRFKHGTN